jgi:hypothetical protein
MAGLRNWRLELIEAYPDIFHPLPDNPGVAQASPECGEGWRDLLERACARIRAVVQADDGSFKAQYSRRPQRPPTASAPRDRRCLILRKSARKSAQSGGA